jgi:hypothetical protein
VKGKIMSDHEDASLFWEKLRNRPDNISHLSEEFKNIKSDDRISLLRSAFHGSDRVLGIMLLPYLKENEKMELFSDLIFLASFTHGGLAVVRETITSLPKEWLLERIEETAEPYLQNGDYEQYRRFLELFSLIDKVITQKLAITALQSSDFDIKEAGEDFLLKDADS